MLKTNHSNQHISTYCPTDSNIVLSHAAIGSSPTSLLETSQLHMNPSTHGELTLEVLQALEALKGKAQVHSHHEIHQILQQSIDHIQHTHHTPVAHKINFAERILGRLLHQWLRLE